MITSTDDIRIHQIRQAAGKAKWRIYKSWAPNYVDDFGGYQVIDKSRNCILFGLHCELDLSDLELIFSGPEVAHAHTS